MNSKKSFLKILATIVLTCLLPIQMFAQLQGKITGRVLTNEREAIVSATIGINGTTIGTYTDDNGNFTLTVPSGRYFISITYVGFKHKEVSVDVQPGDIDKLGDIILEIDNKELNEVVVSALIKKVAEKKSIYVARMPLDNLENPQVYTVIPKELLNEQIAVDLKSVLTTSPGVTSPSLGIGSGGTGLGMRLRGFAAADGAGSIRNGMATNYVSLSDPANIESIEIIKGPSGTLFGTNLISYGGLVNRVTKKAYDGKGGEASFTTGAWSLGRATIDYNTPLDKNSKALFRINAAYQTEHSFKKNGINKTFMFAPTFTFNVSDRLTVRIDGEYFKSDRTTEYLNLANVDITNPNQLNLDWKKSFVASNDITSKSEVINVFGEARYKINTNWTSSTLVSYARTDNDANYVFLDISKKDSLERRLMHIPSLFQTQQVQQNFNGDFYLGNIRNRVLFGLDYTRLTTQDTRSIINNYDGKKISLHEDAPVIYIDQYNAKMANPDRKFNNDRKTNTYSTYVSDVINIIKPLDVMASIRFDRYQDVESNYMQSAWSPKLGVVYQFVEDKASLFVNYLNGFKNVGPREGNADGKLMSFNPEHAFQWEGGFKLEFFDHRLNSTISVYHIKVKDRIRSVKAPTGSAVDYYSVQDGEQVSKGFEIDLIANPISGMNVIAGYGYNSNKYTRADKDDLNKRDPGTPKHVANFWISQKLTGGQFKGLGIGVGGNFASSSFVDSKNKYTVSGYGKFDVLLFYEYEGFHIGLKMNNITDKKYFIGDYYVELQNPRELLGSVSYKF